MASKETWIKVKKYFKPEEFDDPHYPGSGLEIDDELLFLLYQLRERTEWPIIIHHQVGGAVDVEGKWGHATNSYHLLKNGAKAVDFHFKTDAYIREQMYYVISGGFRGIGLYTDWYWNGKKLLIGFHVDVRPTTVFQIWKRIDGKYRYLLV